jgi:pimeloyl-ACP methyl ester carboxylesterase
VTRTFNLALALLLSACTLESYVDSARVSSYHLSGKGIPDAEFTLFDLKSGGGVVKAVHVQNARGHGGSILYCHGVSANIETSWPRVLEWYRLGFDVLLFDYRGYGASSGDSWSEDSLYADAEASLAALLARSHTTSEKIVIYGHSLGGPVAAEMALRHRPAALVLESTFASIEAEIRSNTYFKTPDSFLSDLTLDTEDKVAHMGSFPKLIIHGTADTTWPVWNGKQIFRAATPEKHLALCEGCTHTDVLFKDRAWYRKTLCFTGAPAPLDQCLDLPLQKR